MSLNPVVIVKLRNGRRDIVSVDKNGIVVKPPYVAQMNKDQFPWHTKEFIDRINRGNKSIGATVELIESHVAVQSFDVDEILSDAWYWGLAGDAWTSDAPQVCAKLIDGTEVIREQIDHSNMRYTIRGKVYEMSLFDAIIAAQADAKEPVIA